MRFYLFFISVFWYCASYAQIDSSRYIISFDGTCIHYEETGLGYPVILLHGFLSTGQNWKRTIVYKDLANAGYRVIVPDLRGNGKSDKPHTDKAYAGNAEARDIMLLADSLKITSYYVIGYSRGSIITASLLTLDKRIRKAVLGGMGTDFTNPEWPRRIMFYHVLNGDTSIAELEPLIKRLQSDTSLDRTALTLQQKEQPSTSKSALQAFRKPVLVICGKADSDNGNAKALAKLFPQGKFAEVPGDHGGALITKEFSKEILQFFH